MSEPKNQAINLYGTYNEELKRMHDLMRAVVQRGERESGIGNRGGHYGSGHYSAPDYAFVFQRICELQNILIAALQSHDPLIQEKVAELALTGTPEDDKKKDKPQFFDPL